MGQKVTISAPRNSPSWRNYHRCQGIGTDIGNRDQAAQDLFLSDKLAYRTSGPWAILRRGQEASGLDYDFVVVPGSQQITPPGTAAQNSSAWRRTARIRTSPGNSSCISATSRR
jgi:hypothetical protein